MNPDYTDQLERLIAVLSQEDLLPTWVISIISVVIGALATLLLGLLKEKHEAKRRKMRVERAICGELLLNHGSLFGMFVTSFEFHRLKETQKAFDGLFSFDALENARTQLDVLYEIPKLRADANTLQVLRNDVEFTGRWHTSRTSGS